MVVLDDSSWTIVGNHFQTITPSSFPLASIIVLRLISSDESRVAESYTAFVAKVNTMCLASFRRDIVKEAGIVEQQRKARVEPEDFYNVFLGKVGETGLVLLVHGCGLICYLSY